MRELHWVWMLVLAVAAQAANVRGHVSSDGAVMGEINIELTGRSGQASAYRARVDGTGDFTVWDVPPGQYDLCVTNGRGAVLQRDFIVVQGSSDFFNVRIPTRRVERPVTGTVSARALAHRPPAKAIKMSQKADQFMAKGDVAGAAAQFAKAVELDPQYARAYANLGACYARMHRDQEALAALDRARELDPGLTPVHSNRAQLLLRTKRFEEAEEAARTALRQEPSSDIARFLLGASLAKQGKNSSEALEHLRRASAIPLAHVYAADILASRGESQSALRELRAYLPSAEPGERPAIEAWIAKLEK